jgi:hypothetical protein
MESVTPNPQHGSSGSSQTFERLLNDARLMFEYATEAGLQVDPGIAGTFAEIEEQWFRRRSPDQQGAVATVTVADLMTVHNALAKVVAPATAASIAATEPAPVTFGFLLKPPLIGMMVSAACVCAVGFIVTLPKAAAQAAAAAAQAAGSSSPVLFAQVLPPVVGLSGQQWNLVFGAGLGAAFFGLFNAHEYVKNRTFDPKYNSMYLIRFVLGVIAGLILGNLSTLFSNDPTFVRLGPGVIALLGGFSAEAVNQILQRLVEIMVAVVKGGNEETIKAREEHLKARLATQLSETKQIMGQEVVKILGDPTLPAPVRQQLQALQSKLVAT